jgi:hypothetical protein
LQLGYNVTADVTSHILAASLYGQASSVAASLPNCNATVWCRAEIPRGDGMALATAMAIAGTAADRTPRIGGVGITIDGANAITPVTLHASVVIRPKAFLSGSGCGCGGAFVGARSGSTHVETGALPRARSLGGSRAPPGARSDAPAGPTGVWRCRDKHSISASPTKRRTRAANHDSAPRRAPRSGCRR